MARREKGCSVKWLGRMLAGLAFLRYVLDVYGFKLDMGLVLVADDIRSAVQFAKFFSASTDAVMLAKIGRRIKEPENYRAGVHLFKSKDDEETIMDFLTQENFLPVVVIGGVVPAFLKSYSYILRINGSDLEDIRDRLFADEYFDFRNFVVDRLELIQTSLGRLKSSRAIEEYDGDPEFRMLYEAITAVGAIWRIFVRERKNEQETDAFWYGYLNYTRTQILKIPEFDGAYELAQTVSREIWKYVAEHPEIEIGSIDMVDGRLESAIQNETAILYDMNFYFLSEKLVRNSCIALMDTLSSVELKRRMRDEGIICCANEEYTIKKCYTNVYGIQQRKRFLRFNREFLFSEDGMQLEDFFFRCDESGEGNTEIAYMEKMEGGEE